MKTKVGKNRRQTVLRWLLLLIMIVLFFFSQPYRQIFAQDNTPPDQGLLIEKIYSSFPEPPSIVQLDFRGDFAFGALVIVQNNQIQEGEGKPFIGVWMDNRWFLHFLGSNGFISELRNLPTSLMSAETKQYFFDEYSIITNPEEVNNGLTATGYRLPWACGQTLYIRQDWDSHPVNSTNIALDIDMPLRTVITAAVGGTVFRVKEDSSTCGCDKSNLQKGNYITILNNQGLYDTYVHIAQWGAIPEIGQEVFQGQPIAYSYNTGYTCGTRAVCDAGTCSGSGSSCKVYNHLHFQVEQSIGGTRLRPVFDDVGEVNIGYYTSGNCGETTPPVSSIDLSGVTGENGWFISPISVNINATDDSSGVKYSEYSINGSDWVRFSGIFTINQNGSSVISFRSMDNQGNLEVAKEVIVKIDTVAPINPTIVNPGCGAVSGEWQNACSDPNFSWSGASDDTSGLSLYQYYWGPDPFGTTGTTTSDSLYDPPPVTDGTYHLRIATKDVAGNWSDWQTLFTLRYDHTVPTGSLAIKNNWSVTDQALVILNMNATDSASGVGLMRLRDGGGSWTEWKAYSPSAQWVLPPLTGQTHSVEVQYKDLAGNASPTFVDTILLDIYPDHPSSQNFHLYKSTFGISTTNAESTSYHLTGTLGQLSATGYSQSSAYRITSGYWSWIDKFVIWVKNYLPVIAK